MVITEELVANMIANGTTPFCPWLPLIQKSFSPNVQRSLQKNLLHYVVNIKHNSKLMILVFWNIMLCSG